MKMPRTKGSFFQIDGRSWSQVLQLGMNAAVAYLVLACGTGRDNQRTRWSVNAIERYTGISRGRAYKAIQTLAEHCLLSIDKNDRTKQSPPTYRLRHAADIDNLAAVGEPQWIWLPNELITGAAGETPPVERVRQTQNYLALELLIRLYAAQTLADDGGVHWRLVSRNFTQKKFSERGIWTFIGASPEIVDMRERWTFLNDSPLLKKFAALTGGTESAEDIQSAFNAGLRCLRSLGLVECIPYVLEGETDEAELVFPCDPEAGTTAEKEVAYLAKQAAGELLGETALWQMDRYDIVAPVPKSMLEAKIVGVYRLRYRPKTKMTAAWIAKQKRLEHWAATFEEIVCTGQAGVQPPSRGRP